MRFSFAAKVVLTRKAYCRIRNSVIAANNEFEIGGVLLGYKFLNRYSVAAVTVSAEPADKSNVSFTLDGKWHTACALKYMQKFWRKPSILGVWHSHICDIDVFSEQDRQSNKRLAESFGDILSMITMLTMPSQDLKFTAYLISTNGKETLCQVIVK